MQNQNKQQNNRKNYLTSIASVTACLFKKKNEMGLGTFLQESAFSVLITDTIRINQL
jgi:hypothetical protein